MSVLLVCAGLFGIAAPGSAAASADNKEIREACKKDPYKNVVWGAEAFGHLCSPAFWQHLEFKQITEQDWNAPDATRCVFIKEHEKDANRACIIVHYVRTATTPDKKPGSSSGFMGMTGKSSIGNTKKLAEELHKSADFIDLRLEEAKGLLLEKGPLMREMRERRKLLGNQIRVAETETNLNKAYERMKTMETQGSWKRFKDTGRALSSTRDTAKLGATLNARYDNSAPGSPSSQAPGRVLTRFSGGSGPAPGSGLAGIQAQQKTEKYFSPDGAEVRPLAVKPGAGPTPSYLDYREGGKKVLKAFEGGEQPAQEALGVVIQARGGDNSPCGEKIPWSDARCQAQTLTQMKAQRQLKDILGHEPDARELRNLDHYLNAYSNVKEGGESPGLVKFKTKAYCQTKAFDQVHGTPVLTIISLGKWSAHGKNTSRATPDDMESGLDGAEDGRQALLLCSTQPAAC